MQMQIDPQPQISWKNASLIVTPATLRLRLNNSMFPTVLCRTQGTSCLPLMLSLAVGNREGLDKVPCLVFLLLLEVRDLLQQEGRRWTRGKASLCRTEQAHEWQGHLSGPQTQN